jgi:hypothetical protein
METLLPFNRIESSFVTFFPSGAKSLKQFNVNSHVYLVRIARKLLAESEKEKSVLFSDVVQHHVHIFVETAQSSHQLLIPLRAQKTFNAKRNDLRVRGVPTFITIQICEPMHLSISSVEKEQDNVKVLVADLAHDDKMRDPSCTNQAARASSSLF